MVMSPRIACFASFLEMKGTRRREDDFILPQVVRSYQVASREGVANIASWFRSNQEVQDLRLKSTKVESLSTRRGRSERHLQRESASEGATLGMNGGDGDKRATATTAPTLQRELTPFIQDCLFATITSTSLARHSREGVSVMVRRDP